MPRLLYGPAFLAGTRIGAFHVKNREFTMSIEVRVQKISYEAVGINSYELVPIHTAELPAFTAGAHIDVFLPGGLTRQYSLHNRPGERQRYLISVLHLPSGRGGSDTLHRTTRVGDILSISAPRNHFELVEGAAHYVLVAGGIGITPLMSMMARLSQLQADFVLHYCCRSRDTAAFSRVLEPLESSGRVRFHIDGGRPEQGLDVKQLFRQYRDGTHVFCCGPAGLMTAVRAATSHWPSGCVHFESFSTPLPGAAVSAGSDEYDFEVELATTGQVVQVRHNQTLLEAIRARGIAVESSCEAGTCGTCMTRYLEGEPDHQDFVLGAEEQKEFLMLCVSRSKSRRIKLAL